jgi:hypothetical protein
MDAVNQKSNNKKLSKVLSTKLSIEDYNAFLTLTKLEYEAGLIKEESTSELLRFTIKHILNQVHNQPEYLILKQEQQQQKQVPNISRRNNSVGQKMTSWNYHHYYERKQIS